MKIFYIRPLQQFIHLFRSDWLYIASHDEATGNHPPLGRDGIDRPRFMQIGSVAC
jgi:hypothetical protein